MAKLVKISELPELGLETVNRFHVQESYLLTAKKKRKSDVHGTTAKPYRQKGTGRARQGPRTNPHFTGGGLAFAPQPRTPRKGLNKVVRRSALRSAVLWHVQGGSAWQIEGAEFDGFDKTKRVAGVISELLGKKGSLTLVVAGGSLSQRSSRNLSRVRLLTPERVNVRDLVEVKNLVFSGSALESFRKILDAQNSPAEEVESGAEPGGEE
jgi:large subunit ribosomal protein L4